MTPSHTPRQGSYTAVCQPICSQAEVGQRALVLQKHKSLNLIAQLYLSTINDIA